MNLPEAVAALGATLDDVKDNLRRAGTLGRLCQTCNCPVAKRLADLTGETVSVSGASCHLGQLAVTPLSDGSVVPVATVPLTEGQREFVRLFDSLALPEFVDPTPFRREIPF